MKPLSEKQLGLWRQVQALGLIKFLSVGMGVGILLGHVFSWGVYFLWERFFAYEITAMSMNLILKIIRYGVPAGFLALNIYTWISWNKRFKIFHQGAKSPF